MVDKVIHKMRENGIQATMESIKRRLNPTEQSLVFSPIGYSNAGRVIAKGRLVNNFNVNDRVACAGSGLAAHAEYVTIPINLAVKVPDNVPFNIAAFTTIGSIAMQGIRRAEVTFGETVVITGLGLLGLIAVQIAKAWGLIVIGLDVNPARVEMAKLLGADYCFLANENSSEKKIQELTNGNGVDAVIIYAATKNSDPANQALRICRRKGRVVVVGSIGMELQRDDMYHKELDFVMSTSYGPGRYDNSYELMGIDYPFGYVRWTENRNMMEFVRLVSKGLLDLNPLISNTFTIDQASEAYKLLIENPEHNISNLFIYHHESKEIPISKSIIHHNLITSGKIRVGIIGAGGFLQNNHLPNILKLSDYYELVAIANRTSAGAKTAGEKYKVQYITTDYRQVLNDPDIDMVIIGTRHNLHAMQVVDAIMAGKHVLVEKPLAMNEEELNMICEVHEKYPNVNVSVGFNRRYSPCIQRVKELLLNGSFPILINYRINANHIPTNSWIQNLEEGGGRIIGEVCHFIDLVNYLIGSKVKQVQIMGIPIDVNGINAEDNIVITIMYLNGSIAVITYVSIGTKEIGKERIEVFAGSNSVIIDDFKKLEIYSNNTRKTEKYKFVDKGHYMEVLELAKLLKGEKSLILPFEMDLYSTKITLSLIERLHNRNN